MLKKNWIH